MSTRCTSDMYPYRRARDMPRGGFRTGEYSGGFPKHAGAPHLPRRGHGGPRLRVPAEAGSLGAAGVGHEHAMHPCTSDISPPAARPPLPPRQRYRKGRLQNRIHVDTHLGAICFGRGTCPAAAASLSPRARSSAAASRSSPHPATEPAPVGCRRERRSKEMMARCPWEGVVTQCAFFPQCEDE